MLPVFMGDRLNELISYRHNFVHRSHFETALVGISFIIRLARSAKFSLGPLGIIGLLKQVFQI